MPPFPQKDWSVALRDPESALSCRVFLSRGADSTARLLPDAERDGWVEGLIYMRRKSVSSALIVEGDCRIEHRSCLNLDTGLGRHAKIPTLVVSA